MGSIKEFAKSFVPPIAVGLAKQVLHAINPGARDSPFKYLPKDINPKWIMDIGANEGHVAISALNAFPKANIVCFEPVSDTFKTLQINLNPYHISNPDRRIVLRKLAVSNYSGKAEINITNFSPANSLLKESECYSHYNPGIQEIGKEEIEVVALDDLMKDGKLPSDYFDIVKIDVEGLEKNVLVGGTKFFSTHVDIIIIEVSFQRDSKIINPSNLDIFKVMDFLGFRLINIYDVNNTTYDDPNVMDDTMVTQIDCVFRNLRRIQ